MKAFKKKRFNRRQRDPFLKRAARFCLGCVKVLLLVSALPLLSLGGYRLYRTAITTEHLAVRRIDVAGVKRVSKETIIELSGVREGMNILSFSASQAEDRVRRNPWVVEASVSRRIPNRVSVEVREREPAALVKMDGLYVMDESGVVFKRLADEDKLDLPVVTGLGAEVLGEEWLQTGLLELMRLLRNRKGFSYADVSEIHVDPVYGFAIYTLEDGVLLDLGSGGFEEKLQAFERIVRKRGGLSGIEAMYLNNGSEAIVRFYSDVVKEGGAI